MNPFKMDTSDSNSNLPVDSDKSDALTRLFMKNFLDSQSAIFSYIRSFVPSVEQAREIFQEVSVVLWKKFSEYDPSREFRGWAFGVARKEILRHKYKVVRDKLYFDHETMLKIAKSEIAYREYLDMRLEILQQCKKKLRTSDLDLLIKVTSTGLTLRETAKKLNMSESTLYKNFTRIRKLLLDCIQKTLRMEAGDE